MESTANAFSVPTQASNSCNELYLDLLKRCLINSIYGDPPLVPVGGKAGFNLDARMEGRDWPSKAHTMIGMRRLNNIQELTEQILRRGIAGDFIEAGVWRGGAAMFMRGLLKAHSVPDRIVWVADSFQGLPPEECVSKKSYASPEFTRMRSLRTKNDMAARVSEVTSRLQLGTSLEDVRSHFAAYNLMDEQVRFIPGWFEESLKDAPIEALALLRIDCDIYDSTFQVLSHLYPRVSTGGYVIVDDYNAFSECRMAVHDYLEGRMSCPDLVRVDHHAVFWRKI